MDLLDIKRGAQKRTPFKPTKLLFFWMTFIWLVTICKGQTLDPIQQRSTLRAYDTNSKLYDDEFYIPITEFSDHLHSNKDWTYFFSKIQSGEYAFKKFSHSTMSATTILSSIMLDNYDILDACHTQDTLDYLVGINTVTNKVEVLTLKASGTTYVNYRIPLYPFPKTLCCYCQLT